MTSGRPSQPQPFEVLAAILMGGIAVAQVVAMPLLAPLVVAAFGGQVTDSGLVGLANLVGTAMGSLIVTLWLKRLPFRLTALLATVLAVVAQYGVGLAPGFGTAIALEGLAGAGAGVLLALSAAIVGASANPDRGFAFILTLQALVAVLVLLAIPALGGASAVMPVLLMLAGVQALLLPISFCLRPGPLPGGSEGLAASGGSALHPDVLLKAAGYFIFSAAVGVLWVFSGVLGTGAGIGEGAIGQALAVGNLAAIAGSLLAAVITARLGRIGPVLAVCLALVLSVLLFSTEMGLERFYVASSLYLFAWGCGLPLLMGAVAEVDPGDRVTSLLPVLAFAGMGAGPALVGMMPGGELSSRITEATSGLAGAAFALVAMAQIVWRSAAARPG